MKNVFIVLAITTCICFGAIFLKTRNNSNKTLNSNNKIQVVASFYPLYFFATQIGGDRVNVINITPAGAEPHDYEPTTKDVEEIQKSDLLILNGAGLESWSGKIEGKNELTVSDGIARNTVFEDNKKEVDPHVWLDPVLAQQIVQKIENSYEALSPENALYFKQNAQNLSDKLILLNTEFEKTLNTCSNHDVVTSHAAFGYLATQYNFNQVSISGLTPDEEPTPQKLSEVTKLVTNSHIKYIFFETLVSPRLAETIAKETGAQTLVFDPLEGLSDEALQNGADYFSVQRKNLKNLSTALYCM